MPVHGSLGLDKRLSLPLQGAGRIPCCPRHLLLAADSAGAIELEANGGDANRHCYCAPRMIGLGTIMLYLVALIVPPLAVLLAGHPWQALLNLAIFLVTVPILAAGPVALAGSTLAVIHALVAVHGEYADCRMARWHDQQRGAPSRPSRPPARRSTSRVP